MSKALIQRAQQAMEEQYRIACSEDRAISAGDSEPYLASQEAFLAAAERAWPDIHRDAMWDLYVECPGDDMAYLVAQYREERKHRMVALALHGITHARNPADAYDICAELSMPTLRGVADLLYLDTQAGRAALTRQIVADAR